MSFPRYPSYKDSGVEWLGEVPAHWEVNPLKRACHVFPSNVDKKSHDGETPVRLCNYTDVYYNEMITAGMEFMVATASADQIAKFTLRAGDTIITKDSETADDIAIGAYVPADLPGVVCGYHLSMVRPMPDSDGAFVKRLFDSVYAKSCFAVLANGLTRVGLGQYELDNVELPFPPKAEQTGIAAFLDRETGKIDKLVAEQRRLMELLKEKRQAVISHAVTRGLNPAAPLKSSGIEWLGDVPSHWETKPLKAVAKLFGRIGFRGYTTEDLVDEGQGAITLSPSNMVEGKMALEKCTFISWAKYEESPEIQISAGDVLIVKTGSTFGKVAFVDKADKPMTINPQIAVFKRLTCEPRFLFHVLSTPAIQSLIEISNKGSTIPTMTQESVGNFWIGLPPYSEQTEIVAFIEAELAQLDTLAAEAQRAIDLLQERRTALISAAVTGQIDVRKEVG